MNAKEIFNNFVGEWKLSRIINLESKLNCYKAYGSAHFRRSNEEDNLLLYAEELIINYNQDDNPDRNLNKTQIKAVQSYKYAFDNSKNVINKLFKDGRHFYELDVREGTAHAKHMCINDSYVADYVFNKNKFSLTYSVSGPKKDYIIQTIFEKILH